MIGDPLHLAYKDSALLWHAQVYIFSPSTSMRYEDAIKVLRKVKHHYRQG
jgi:hypothetical protein